MIMAAAERSGRVDVETLSTSFEVTPQTIRKDLNDLCDRDLLLRTHGGAVYPQGASNFAYVARQGQAPDAKRDIGAAAASLIGDNASVFLTIGTTTEQVATHLRSHTGLMVITNNLNVATILADAPSCQLVIAGGLVRKSDGGIVGEATLDFVGQFRVDFAVIGVSAIDADGTLLDYDYREVRVLQEIIRLARRTILVADATKFERNAPVRIASLSDIDILVTDRDLPAPLAEFAAANGVRVNIPALAEAA
ncbi:MAG: DeoR/GlpR family DNA-binding transcription regulator [Pseudomonadota bacterium]